MKPELKQIVDVFAEVMKSIHQRSYQRLVNLKLYPGQPQLLKLIRENEGITQKELSEKNFVKPATITGMLSKLEANHYVYRVPDEEDKRMMRVYLTPEGKLLADQGAKYMMMLTEKMFDGFTEEELHTFLQLSEKLRKNLLKEENSHNEHDSGG